MYIYFLFSFTEFIQMVWQFHIEGSIIGPLLFLLYVNNLPNSNLVSKVRMYADDTRLTYASSSPGDLSHSMNDYSDT